MEQILSSKLNDPAVVSLLSGFETSLNAGLEAICAGVESGDVVKIKQYCHKLGGSAAIFGFELLAKRLNLLEQTAEGLTKKELEILFEDIRKLSLRLAM